MIRIITRTVDAACLVHTGEGKATTSFQTFNLDAPDLETFLRQRLSSGVARDVVGVEVLPVESSND